MALCVWVLLRELAPQPDLAALLTGTAAGVLIHAVLVAALFRDRLKLLASFLPGRARTKED
jgi:hypothetical protein